MNRILVPCDFSDPAKQAFKFAANLASIIKGEVFLLNVVEMPVIHGSMLVPVQAYEAGFLKGLKAKYLKNVEKLKTLFAGKVKVHSFLEHGTVEKVIEKFIDKKKIDLVVMGTHGTSTAAAFFFGSNTQKVVRHSKVPVVAVKKAVSFSSIKNIILPLDLNLIEKKHVDFIKQLQKIIKARLHVLYINHPENFVSDPELEKSLDQFVKSNHLKNYKLDIFNDYTEEDGIINFSNGVKNKLLVMLTHGRRGVNRFFKGSITEQIVKNVQSPILTLLK